MASTKEMQQRAKQLRQQAKEDLKPKLSIEILAIRHQKNGLPEFTQFAVEKVKPINDKNRLLAAICKNKWGHKPPYNYIAEYLIQTNSFKMFEGFGQTNGYIINFYESDYDRPETYSCRDIIATNPEGLKDMAKTLAHVGDYDVKTY